MKKINIIFSIISCLLIASCNKNNSNDVSQSNNESSLATSEIHTHTFESNWSSDDTYHFHKATCTHNDEVSAKAKHEWDNGIVSKEPTALEKGTKTYTCNVCKRTKTEDIDPLGAIDNTLAIKDGASIIKEYTGEAVKITKEMFTYNGNGEISFAFKNVSDEEFSESIPSKVGNYKIKVSVAATEEWKAISEEFDLIIAKAELRIGHEEFHSYYKNNTWTNEFTLNKGNGVLEVLGELEEVKISISQTNTWSDRKTFDLYLESENKEKGREYVTLIGKDANNYELSASADGDLDATLYCHRVETTKVTGKLLDKKWGSFPVNNICFNDKTLTAVGEQDCFITKILDSDNKYKSLSFAILESMTNRKIAEAYRKGIKAEGFDYQFINATYVENIGGEDDIIFNLLPNIEGFTDENGSWIYQKEEISLTLVITASDVERVINNKKAFDGKLKTDTYLVGLYSQSGGGEVELIIDDENAQLEIGIFCVEPDGSLSNNYYDKEYMYLEAYDYYVVIRVISGGTGGITII